jgi:hypothetical protein
MWQATPRGRTSRSSAEPPSSRRQRWRVAFGLLILTGAAFVPTMWSSPSYAGARNLVPNGAPTLVTFDPGQTSETYVYTATAGQYMTLDITDGTWSSELGAELKIYDPNDKFVAYTYFGHNGLTGELGPLLAGTYTFALTATSESSAQSAEFYFATDQTGRLATNDMPFAFQVLEPGRYGRFTFNATAGQTFMMQSTGDFASECDLTAYLLDPTGANQQYSCVGQDGLFDFSIPTTGTWTLYIVNPNLLVGLIEMNAYLTPEPGGWGYAWANEPTATSYSPEQSYSSNSTGATTHIKRNAVGSYTVTFPGLAVESSNGGTADVTAYGTDGSCSPSSWSDNGTAIAVEVDCEAPGGTPQDDEFDVLYGAGGTAAPSDLSYLVATEPTTPSYTADPVYEFNTGGGTDTIVRNSTGDYTVEIPGIGANSGTVKVSAEGGLNPSGLSTNCYVGSWFGSPTVDVNVLCTDTAGNPADSDFTMTWVNNSSLLATAGGRWGYVWANEPTSTSYTPDPDYEGNSATSASATITRTATGTYQVDFPKLGGKKGDVQAGAYGSDAVCNTGGWGSDGHGGASVDVNCFSPTGASVDTEFVAQYIVG